MAVYFNNPVMAQQRMADDQLPMQQEALRLQELAQLLQASQQNKQTDSQERQNRERVGAQRYQTETWGGVGMGQNENIRRRDDAATLQAINDLALRREQMIKDVELEKGRQLTSKEIAQIQSQRSLMRPQDAAENERQNLEIERTNRTASGLANSINESAKFLEDDDLKKLAKEYQGTWDVGDPNDDKVERAKAEVAKRKAQGVYARAAITGLGGRPEDVFGMLDISGGVAQPIISPRLSLGATYGGQNKGAEIAGLLGLVGGLSEADLSPRMNLPAFGYEADQYGRPVNPVPRSEAVMNLPATVNVDQFGRPVQGTNTLDAIKLMLESARPQTNSIQSGRFRINRVN